MSTDSCQDMAGLPAPPTVKVHAGLCSNLRTIVDLVSEIIPEIEAARPGALGIEALCQLYKLIEKAKSLLQRCSELSVLFLVLAGNTILTRCKMLKHLIKQSLSNIQKTVPLTLAAKISQIILEVKSMDFCLDSSEMEARAVLRDLLNKYSRGITDGFALSAIHAVCSSLRISSPKAIRVEKRSISKLIDKFGEGGRAKRKVLIFFQNLLNKYGEVELEQGSACLNDMVETGLLSWPAPPKEFLCPLSAQLMQDPVVIASGLTYDRASIQQWFEKGHDTCPVTNEKLEHFWLIPNEVMKDIVSKWCAVDRVCTKDRPRKLMSSINSIGSLASCIDDLSFD